MCRVKSLVWLAALALVSCDPNYVEARLAQLCQRQPAQRFEIPADVRAQLMQLPPALRQVEVRHTFDLDFPLELPATLQDLVATDFALSSIRLTAAPGSAPLGFVAEAHVTLPAAETPGLVTRHFDYVRSEPEPTAIGFRFEPIDVSPYLAKGELQYQVSVVGTLPDGDLVVDLEVCGSATLRFHYF